MHTLENADESRKPVNCAFCRRFARSRSTPRLGRIDEKKNAGVEVWGTSPSDALPPKKKHPLCYFVGVMLLRFALMLLFLSFAKKKCLCFVFVRKKKALVEVRRLFIYLFIFSEATLISREQLYHGVVGRTGSTGRPSFTQKPLFLLEKIENSAWCPTEKNSIAFDTGEKKK